MYVVRLAPKMNADGLRAFALRTAKRRLDRAGHRSLRQGASFACVRCHRTATLLVNEQGYFVSGNLPAEHCN